MADAIRDATDIRFTDLPLRRDRIHAKLQASDRAGAGRMSSSCSMKAP